MEGKVNTVEIKSVSLRLHDSHGRSHIEFTDSKGISRLGYILPENTPVHYLDSIYAGISGVNGILFPDGLSKLKDGSFCLSVKNGGFSPLKKTLTLSELIYPLYALHNAGINHLSIDKYSFVVNKETVSLVF